jgi:hypothetical protein
VTHHRKLKKAEIRVTRKAAKSNEDSEMIEISDEHSSGQQIERNRPEGRKGPIKSVFED